MRLVPIVVGEPELPQLSIAATHVDHPVVVAGRGAGLGRGGWWVRVEHAFPTTEPIPPTRQMTMKMGLERGLLETIPEILAVEQVSATGEALCDDTVMEVLDEIRPFLKNMGGDIELIRVDATDLQPSCTLRLTGPSAALRSIKGEIIQARPHDPPFPRPAPSTRPLHTPPHKPDADTTQYPHTHPCPSATPSTHYACHVSTTHTPIFRTLQ